MYFDDFTRLVRRHRAPNADIHYLVTRFGPLETVSILDYSYPHRDPPVVTGHSGFDWYTSSFICNATAGELPPVDIEGAWREQQTHADGAFTPAGWIVRPRTGYLSVLAELFKCGCIVPSAEMDKLFGEDTRRKARYGNRLYYF